MSPNKGFADLERKRSLTPPSKQVRDSVPVPRSTRHPMLQLQQRGGNRAVGRILQAKLTVGEENDEYEKEADRMASHGVQPTQLMTANPPSENRTGMPDQLKSGLEQLSGFDLSGVRVHNNSAKPAQLNALAYAQGQDIHLGPGQEKHLLHEAWHVVQQMQGRVKATMPEKGGVNVNDDPGLEKEADFMGQRALHRSTGDAAQSKSKHPLTGDGIIQRKVGMEFQTVGNGVNVRKKQDDKYEKNKGTFVLATGNGFKVTADNSDLEFITSAYEETDDGKKNLLAAVGGIVGYCKVLENIGNIENRVSIKTKKSGVKDYAKINEIEARRSTLKGLFAGLTLDTDSRQIEAAQIEAAATHPHDKEDNEEQEEFDNDRFIIHVPKDVTGHPQANVGIKIEKILQIMEILSREKPTEATTLEDIYRETLGWGSYKKSKQREGTEGAVNKADTVIDLTPKGKGLLALIASYSRGAAALTENTPYAKNAAPIMSRTALSSIYKQLEDNDKRFLLTLMKNQELLNDILGRSIEEELFKSGVGDKDKPDKSTQFTIEDWLKDLFAGKEEESSDKLSHMSSDEGIGGDAISDLYDHEDAQGDLDYFGMSRATDIGLDVPGEEKVQVHGALLELRALGRQVPYTRWPEVTEAVFDLTRYVNSAES